MRGSTLIFKWMSFLTNRKETIPVLHDPTVYNIRTKTQQYIGNIAFQNDTFMKVSLATDNQKVVKILKENIQKVEILSIQHG